MLYYGYRNVTKKLQFSTISTRGYLMYVDRIKQYKTLEKEFKGKILSYITGDRNGFETRIAADAIDLIIAQLDKIGSVKRIVLYLYTRGGDTAAAWNIVNLFRMFCDDLVVIVPHKAHSAGTIISLGANKIIMTKQATLSPIDPSIITPLNPVAQESPFKEYIPVSVEAVKGFIEFAREQCNIQGEEATSKILLKLAENVHPLTLGEVYRSRAQIKMLAGKLLANQIRDENKIEEIIDFLCSDSGSHDYTINRREAKDGLGLNVEKPTEEQYRTIKVLYDDFSAELGFGQTFDPRTKQGAYSVRQSFIESIEGGSDYFATEGRTEMVTLPDGQQAMAPAVVFEGWRHEKENDALQETSLQTEKGEVQYEQDSAFKL